MRRSLAQLALPLCALAACAAPVAPQDEPRPAAYFVSGPEVGQRAPLFTLEGATREGALPAPFDLALQRGRVTVLAFYPRDFTSGCTAQFQTFRDRGAELFGDSVTVVGLSVDSVSTHVRFAESIGHPYPLLSDPDLRVARMYGSAGDQGFARRTVYVIGKDGRVAYRNLRFGALDPKAYEDLRAAVAAAR